MNRTFRLYTPSPVPVADEDEADWAAQELADAERRFAFRANGDEE